MPRLRTIERVDAELAEQGSHSVFDLIADGADRAQRLPLRIVERPIQVAASGKDRALVATARGDDDIGGRDGWVIEAYGYGLHDIDPNLCHRLGCTAG